MKVAAVQMTSTRDVAANLREAGRLVADAASQGAELVVLPENFSFLGATDADRVAAIEPFGDGAAQRFLAEAARAHGVWLVGGTIPVRDAGADRASSRSLLVGPDGRVTAHYDKIVLGTDVVVVPAAFTVPTGEVHWLPLLQARAIESLVYVVAAGQWGEHAGGRKTYGHSLILGPWGQLLAELPAGPGVVCADLDMIALADLRQRFPTVTHRREL
jgi:predicted amidohydrolase